jgi:hypothetical protein
MKFAYETGFSFFISRYFLAWLDLIQFCDEICIFCEILIENIDNKLAESASVIRIE